MRQLELQVHDRAQAIGPTNTHTNTHLSTEPSTTHSAIIRGQGSSETPSESPSTVMRCGLTPLCLAIKIYHIERMGRS